MNTVLNGGSVAAGLGFLALLGWALGIPFLATFAPNRIPMAPSAALLFVLYGVAVLLRALRPLSSPVRWVGVAVSSAGALVAGTLLVLSSLGIRSNAEHLGFTVAGAVGGAAVGHMSPIAAVCFLLASASFFATLRSSSSRLWRAETAWWTACAVLTTAGALSFAYLFQRPLFYGGTFIPPALPTSLALAALGMALLGLAGTHVGPAGEKAGPLAHVPYPLVLVFVLLGAGVVALSGFYLRSQGRHYRSQVEAQLSAVAELKKDELVQWRLERLGDASVLQDNPAFSALVGRVLGDPQDAAAGELARGWLAKLQKHYGYDRVTLLDARGAELLAAPEGRAPDSSVVARLAPEVLKSRKVVFRDFHRSEHDSRVYLTVLAPIVGAGGGSQELGVVALRIDPEAYLYPLIKRWPTPARTAETLLVARDGNDVVYLNELKYRKDTALELRVPIARQEMAVVKAALGQVGTVEARDYRGVPVVAALRAVPGSPWFLVARIDTDELNAPLRERLWTLILAVCGLLAAAAALSGLLWRGQRVRHFREKYEVERERAWMKDVIARSLNEVYAFDPDTLRFRFANLGACRNSGYTEDEFASLTPLDLKPEFTPETFRALLQPLRAAGRPAHAFETIHRRKDGTTYPVEVHLQLVDSGAGTVFLAIVNDITERRRAESRVRHLNRVYALLSDVNQMIVHVREPQALFAAACRIAVETGGFRMAWVGLRDAKENRVRPVAWAGVTDGYLEKLRIDLGDGPRAKGPTATVLRTGGHDVCNDIENDPRMAPWRDAALALGYRASAAFPLAVAGEILGAFNLYSGEPGFFDTEELRLLDEMAADLSFAMEMDRLEDVRARLATAIEQAPVSVVMTDTSGRIEYVNPAFTSITGFAPEEALGRNPRMLKSGKTAPALYQELWAAIKAGKNWQGELVNRRKDGRFYTEELTIAPVRDPAGEAIHFVAIGQDVTERKRAEEAHRSAEALYRGLFEQSPDGVLLIDAETGKTLEANEAAHRQLGYSSEEFAALGISDYEVNETPADVQEHLRKILAEGSDDFETLHRTKKGEIRNVHVWARRLRLGERLAFHSVFEDITDRMQAEAALRKSEARFRRVVDHVTDAIVVEDVEGRIVFANDAYCTLFGYERETALQLQLDDFVAPHWRAVLRDRHDRRVRGESVPDHFEYEGTRSDGRLLWLDAKVVPVTDEAGRVAGTQSTIRDVTGRKQAEDAILEEKAFSEAMLESLPGFFFLFDHTGKPLRWNRTLERVSGYSAEEIRALRPHDFFAAEDQALVEERVGRVFETGSGDAEVSLLSKDGRRIPYYFVGARTLVRGEPCCIGTGFDITARKHVEALLRQAQKIEAIGRLAGGVAHDFNNIVAVIMGYGELAQDQLGPEHPVRPQVDEMLKAARRAADLTQQLLAFSRKQVTDPRVLDLNRIVADTRQMLGRLIGEDLEVVIRTAPDLGAVKADPGQIVQIILNLAVNARDAMPRGGSLTIETANVELDEDYAAAHPPATPGRYVLLAVSDTGTGMDEETKARLFEPFFTTKPQGQGTGLGLATVYGIVKQSDGFIWVTSEPGHGTTLKVYLPRVEQKPTYSGTSPTLPEESGGTETILVAEDTEELRTVIRATLERRGYTVLVASNGEEALSVARKHDGPISLLLTDVVMPKLGGGELAKQLSAQRPGQRVLYMSGYTDGVISQHGVLMEGVRLLQKPFTGRQLAQAVREVLDAPVAEPPAPREARVLLVEDDVQVRKLTSLTLERAGYRVVSVGTVAAATEALASGREYVAILCDLTLPDGSGEDVVRHVKETRPELCERVVVLTGGTTDAVSQRLLAAGVAEVLQKPVARDALLRSVAAVAGR